MYRYIIAIAALFTITSCANQEENADNSTADTLPIAAEEVKTEMYCYLFTEGSENQDTNIVKLIIDGNIVTGEMKYLPWQKDASVGTLSGTKDGNNITADWSYWQEGMETKEPVKFTIEGNSLRQQFAAYDGEKYFFPDGEEGMQEYTLVDCSIFPDRDY